MLYKTLIICTYAKVFFISHNKANNCTYIKCVYHMLYITDVSFTIAIIRVIDKITRHPNKLLKCMCEPLTVTQFEILCNIEWFTYAFWQEVWDILCSIHWFTYTFDQLVWTPYHLINYPVDDHNGDWNMSVINNTW